LNGISNRKESGVPKFTEDNVQRIMINPFYAITVALQLTQEHEPAMGEAEWVWANASLMGEMGAERWLRQLLEVLNGDIVTAHEVGFAPPSGTLHHRPQFTQRLRHNRRLGLGFNVRLCKPMETVVNKLGVRLAVKSSSKIPWLRIF
jgi:hypothetical protein